MRTLLTLLPLLILTGCGPDAGDVVDEHRAAAESRLEQFRTVGEAAGTETELKDIELPDRLEFVRDTSVDGNACLLQSELFYDDLETRIDLLASDDWFVQMPAILSADGGNRDPTVLRSYFERLLNIKYAVIARTRLYSEPEQTGDATFKRGQWSGELLVYEVETGDYLGGVSVNALNEKPSKVPLEYLEDWLRNDLWEKSRKAVNDALEPHSERLPFDRD